MRAKKYKQAAIEESNKYDEEINKELLPILLKSDKNIFSYLYQSKNVKEEDGNLDVNYFETQSLEEAAVEDCCTSEDEEKENIELIERIVKSNRIAETNFSTNRNVNSEDMFQDNEKVKEKEKKEKKEKTKKSFKDTSDVNRPCFDEALKITLNKQHIYWRIHCSLNKCLTTKTAIDKLLHLKTDLNLTKREKKITRELA